MNEKKIKLKTGEIWTGETGGRQWTQRSDLFL